MWQTCNAAGYDGPESALLYPRGILTYTKIMTPKKPQLFKSYDITNLNAFISVQSYFKCRSWV